MIDTVYNKGNINTTNTDYRNIKGTRKDGFVYKYNEDEIREYIKCKQNILYFIEKYCYFRNGDVKVKVSLKDYQIDIIDTLETTRMSSLQYFRSSDIAFPIFLKILHECIFKKDITNVVLSEYTKELWFFQEVYKELPFFLKPSVTTFRKDKVVFSNGCRVFIHKNYWGAIGYQIHRLYYIDGKLDNKFRTSIDVLYPNISTLSDSKLLICFENSLFTTEDINTYDNIQSCLNYLECTWARDIDDDDNWETYKRDSIRDNLNKYKR